MQQFTVNTPTAHYAVICQRGALARAGALISGFAEHTGCVLLSSPRVWRHWGAALERSFREHGGAKKILFDDAESRKTFSTVENICRQLVRAGADRRVVLVALGGGVVGDIAGFVAACYLRGVRVVQVPTTLVAQVDSAIGGKTGVNLPEGKNLAGAFHQPRLVIADPKVLHTLSARQYRSGVYEVIKYGVISDGRLFEYLEDSLPQLLAARPAALDKVIPRCIRVKADIVGRDEHERDLRRILNFGHTLGHALEAATNYRRFLHGEAVGWGMLAATEIARRRGLLAARDAGRISSLILRAGRLPSLPRIPRDRLWRILRGDKKSRAGKLHFVLPKRIGEVEIAADIPDSLVEEVWAGLSNLARE